MKILNKSWWISFCIFSGLFLPHVAYAANSMSPIDILTSAFTRAGISISEERLPGSAGNGEYRIQPFSDDGRGNFVTYLDIKYEHSKQSNIFETVRQSVESILQEKKTRWFSKNR
jgi:hypothetical protein